MAISFRSQTFQDTKSALDSLADSGELTRENFDDKVRELGVDPKDYRDAFADFKVAVEEGERDFTGRGILPVRVAGRAIGETVESVEDVVNAIAGTDLDFGNILPDSVREYASEIFDPYHGSGSYGSGEKLVGDVASYFIPGMGAFKAGKGALALGKALPGTRAAIISGSRKAGRKGRKAGKVAGMGLAGSFGTTIIEDPRDNLFDMLIEDDEGEEVIKKLEQDPSDPDALDYLDAFVKNSLIEVPAAFAFGLPVYLTKAYKSYKASRPAQKLSFLGRLNKFTDSRLGTDDKTLASIIKRHGAAKAAVIRADGLAKDLDRSIKKEITNYTPEMEVKVNNALQFSEDGLVSMRNNINRLQAKERRMVDKYNLMPEGPQKEKYAKKIKEFREGELKPAKNTLLQMRRNKIDYDELGQVAPETRNILDNMRSNIDDLSTYVENNVVKGKLQGVIQGNKGFYLNRSYEAFDNPEYAKELTKRVREFKPGTNTDEVLEGVHQYLLDSGVEASKIPETMEKLLPQMGDDAGGILQFMSDRAIGGGTGTSRVLSKRGDIAAPLRAMWGEVTDAKKNYVKTFEKLSVMKAEDEFLRELAEDLVGKGFASRTKSEAFDMDIGAVAESRLGKIMGRGKVAKNQISNPLEEVYANKNYKEAIEVGLDEDTPTNGMLKTFMFAKGATQTAKTVMSPATHGRNLIGNVVMLAANGIVPGFKSSGKALEQTASRLAGKNNKELGEIAARYSELGIIDSGVGVNLIRRNLNALTKGGENWMDKTALTRGTKKVNTFLTNLYQAEDDIFKIIHFEKTKDYIRKAYPNKTTKQIEEMAAQRTRDMMPNYGLVPRFVKNLRAAPVGDFIAFPAEMIRTTKNLVTYTLRDLASGNAELQKSAAKRLAGMTSAAVGGSALSNYSRQFHGITDDQEDAINVVVPSYEAFQDRVYTSGINKDKMGKVGVNYINLGPLDPYSYLKKGALLAHKMIADGSLNETELNQAAIAMLDNQLGPFLEPSMITKAAIDLVQGDTYKDETSAMGVIQKAVKIAVDPFIPGVANYLKKRYQYEQTKAGSNKIISPFVFNFDEGKNLPEGITPYPSNITISGSDQAFGGDVGIPAFFGVRNQRFDITGGMEFALNPTISKINNSNNKVNNLIADRSLYGDDASDDIYRAYIDGQKKRLAGFQELKALTDSYRSLLGDDYGREIVKGMKYRGKKKKLANNFYDLLNLAASNMYKSNLPSFGPAERTSFTPVPYDRIINLQRKLDGLKIEEE